MEFLKNLNAAQLEAVKHGSGPLLILAGAGSGKTRVITCRIAYLIKVLEVAPYNILAVTFTNKAAQEMKERLGRLLGFSTMGLWVSTFHAAAVRILRREAARLGLDPRFVIYDDYDQVSLIKRIMNHLKISPKDINPRAVAAAISRAKNNIQTAAELAKKGGNFFHEAVVSIYLEYEKELKAARALDFDDLIMKTVQLFTDYPEVCKRYRERFLYILVDEYQDVNQAQYHLVWQLAGTDGNICVVGDPDQGIYSFRGADIQNILSFEEDFPRAKVVRLEENYRSTGNILKAAQHVIESNEYRKDKRLWTRRGRGEPIVVKELMDEKQEAQFVLAEALELSEKGYGLEDIAVLYRTNAQSRAFEELLVRKGLPYKIVGGYRFYDRKEIKDTLAYLKILYNPQDIISLQRIINTPRRGIGKASWEALLGAATQKGITVYAAMSRAHEFDLPARQQKALSGFRLFLEDMAARLPQVNLAELTEEILKKSGYYKELASEPDAQSRRENIQELLNVLAQVKETGYGALESFLTEVALIADVDEYNEAEQGLTLMTLHAAKGLEFPVIFMVGMEEGFCPHARSLANEELEEERRLCYVGITRAQERLYITRAKTRKIFGTLVNRMVSPFISSLPADTLSEDEPECEELPEEKNVSSDVCSDGGREFRVGEKVNHPMWGIGTIVSRKGEGKDLVLTLAFPGQGVKDILVDYVDLQLVKKN